MSEFVSLAAAQDPEFADSRLEAGKSAIQWNMSLPPHLDAEKIQINMTRLGIIHRVGAFTGSTVDEYQGEVTESDAIAGINADGTAVAGKATTLRAPQSESSLLEHPLFAGRFASEIYGKPIIEHRINRPEAVQNVIAVKEKGASDEKAWAKVLDSALRSSFREGGRANLKDRPKTAWKAAGYSLFVFALAGGLGALENGSRPDDILFYTGLWAFLVMNDSLVLKYMTGSPLLDQRRWSLLIANQADRYIALSGVSRVPGLIKCAN